MQIAPITISVVVCTADRPRKLKALLTSLSEIVVPPEVTGELVLINNRPATDLGPILDELSSRMPLSIVSFPEARRGVGAARNSGLKHSRGQIVAFTDDDCVVDPDWLARICESFASDPDLMGLGGRVELFDTADGPITVLRGTSRAELSSFGQVFGFLHGCNMAFRRELLDRLGGFDPDFGVGAPVNSGDDAEFLYRACQAGAAVRYEPDVVVYHDHGRRTRSEIRKTLIRYHLANAAILAKHARAGDADARALLRNLAKGPLASFSRRPYSVFGSLQACYHFAIGCIGAARYWRLAVSAPGRA